MTWSRSQGETLMGVLEGAAEAHPDKVAVYFGDDPLTYGELLDRSRATANRLVDLAVGPGDTIDRPDDPSSIVYTSGTTGPSKGAVMSQGYMVHLGRQLSACWYREPDDVFYACTPLFHLASKGCGVLGSIVRGATCVLDQR